MRVAEEARRATRAAERFDGVDLLEDVLVLVIGRPVADLDRIVDDERTRRQLLEVDTVVGVRLSASRARRSGPRC